MVTNRRKGITFDALGRRWGGTRTTTTPNKCKTTNFVGSNGRKEVSNKHDGSASKPKLTWTSLAWTFYRSNDKYQKTPQQKGNKH